MIKSNHTTLVSLALLAAAFVPASGAADKAAPAKGTPGDADAGKGVYLRVCFACHQPTGLGLPGAFPPLAGAAPAVEADPGKIIRIVLHGLQGPIEVKGVKYNSMMPPHGPQLKDKEIADVLTYVRSAWENKAPAVTVEAVAAIRAKESKRTTPWTWAELTK
jgi:mono/diheme cytochrome c family protein